eukprot:TRINITY_DN32448_c0_g1_i1.p1 TRINITY_DN32448_c0_g1~~TRINITY_DN32448_c0_g1_i1.p1  ORF type:complete len:305 (+),score=39.47 TRINITY_DN32448_c0_g1_i1:6-920(+)
MMPHVSPIRSHGPVGRTTLIFIGAWLLRCRQNAWCIPPGGVGLARSRASHFVGLSTVKPRFPRGLCQRAAAETGVPALLQADEAASFLATATSALGYVATFLSLGIYTPQAVRLWNKKSAEGLAESTWVLKIFAVTSTALFSLHLGLPVNAWADVSLTIQAAVVNAFLFAFGSDEQRGTILPAAVVYCVWIVAFAFDAIPEVVFSAFQSLAAASLTLALAPQILLNYEKNDAGNFSPLTSALGFLLSSIRVFTTLAAGANPILLATWAGAALANGILTAQIVYYSSQKGVGFAEIFTSDLKSSK